MSGACRSVRRCTSGQLFFSPGEEMKSDLALKTSKSADNFSLLPEEEDEVEK
jgi:hypothetical protein